MLPLLVRAYLETCDRRGLTKLQPAAVLLSSGKPRLSKGDILAHAEKYRSFTEAAQASEAIARDLDRRPERTNADAALVAVDVLSPRGGVRDGETLIFDLKGADGYLVFGPYLWYPAGSYEATFNLAVTRVAPDPTNKLAIDIVDNTDRYLAQQDLSPIPSATESTLQFVVDRNELFLAFRVFATGFAGGELRFGGVKLRPRRAAKRLSHQPKAGFGTKHAPQKGGMKPRSNQSRSVADMVISNFIGAGFRTTSSYHARSYACGGRGGGVVNCHDLPKPEQCKTAGEPNVPTCRKG